MNPLAIAYAYAHTCMGEASVIDRLYVCTHTSRVSAQRVCNARNSRDGGQRSPAHWHQSLEASTAFPFKGIGEPIQRRSTSTMQITLLSHLKSRANRPLSTLTARSSPRLATKASNGCGPLSRCGIPTY